MGAAPAKSTTAAIAVTGAWWLANYVYLQARTGESPTAAPKIQIEPTHKRCTLCVGKPIEGERHFDVRQLQQRNPANLFVAQLDLHGTIAVVNFDTVIAAVVRMLIDRRGQDAEEISVG